ncbi:DUF4340 domain-containing protein [Megalodesulfovibrio gigas]|uniref:DUF4340 domain-containing protein n=1 Tax=Megalodesulfovibrio gigas (strain ATCC 19364 / DSM 1382 / NCIMB 9332 / VKM B-1759) TaxID=1121448 RepID=T2G7T9_MEGG1|nr:DUF4340 domain-containing protein [Megalodesulfovibrio gigas]AGW12196.1 hypothetical protein DGI_0265 [Megalodesulfovibrio gigas DSM 1382 = ATCC 19364]
MKRLAILFVLAGLVWGAFSLMPEPQAPPSRPAVAWPRLAPEQLLRAESTTGNASFVLEKEGGDWFISQADPARRLRAERGKAEALANFFNANPPRRSLVDVDVRDTKQLKAYGLDAPGKRLILADTATRYTLAFGGKNPAGDAVYATLEQDPAPADNGTGVVYLLGANWLEQATTADAYYDLRLTSLMAQNITRIRVDNQDIPVELRRTGPAQYAFAQPEDYAAYPVSSLDAERLLLDVVGLKGQLVPQTSLSANATAALSLSLWPMGAETPQQLQFFPVPGNNAQYLAKSDWQPALLAVDRTAVLKVAPDPFLLRDRRVLSFDPAAVQSQRLAFFEDQGLTPREVVLMREGGTRPAEDLPSRDWTRQDTNATVPGLDLLLWRLSESTFEADAASSRPAAARDVLRWTLLDIDGATLKEVTFAADPGLPEGQCWLIPAQHATDAPTTGQENATYYPVTDDVLQQALDTVFHARTPASSF